MSLKKEFNYSDKNFQFLKKKVKQLAGISLADSKNEMVYSRVSRLLRQYRFDNFDAYCDSLKQNNPKMINEFVNAITTNFTSFMREAHHFVFLKEKILPELVRLKAQSKKIRIWSAGCSTGEEAFSISFVVSDFFKNHPGWDVKILATDIDSDALNKAELAVYPSESIEDLPHAYQLNPDNYIEYDSSRHSFKIKNNFKQMVAFKNFNLMSQDAWPMAGPFDVIFCRNVLIYFDRSAQYEVVQKFSKLLSVQGFLILGHSESLLGALPEQLKFINGTIYRRSE